MKLIYEQTTFPDVILKEVTKIVEQLNNQTMNFNSAEDTNICTEGLSSQRIHINRFFESHKSSITINIDVVLDKEHRNFEDIFPFKLRDN